MKRLTYKNEKYYLKQGQDLSAVIQKLGKLEDLEEELGCSLEEAVRLLKERK